MSETTDPAIECAASKLQEAVTKDTNLHKEQSTEKDIRPERYTSNQEERKETEEEELPRAQDGQQEPEHEKLGKSEEPNTDHCEQTKNAHLSHETLLQAAQTVIAQENAESPNHPTSDASRGLKNAFSQVVNDDQQIADTLKEIAQLELAQTSRLEEESPHAQSPSGGGRTKSDCAEERYSKSFSKRREQSKNAKLAAWGKLYREVSVSPRQSAKSNIKSSRSSSRSQTRHSSNSNGSKSRLQQFSAESRERLAGPKPSKRRGSKSSEYEKEDDALNCTFEPKINKSSKNMIRGSGNFMKRFESAHESKTRALKNKRGKAEYDARVDKKVCPQCDAEQSYDEFSNHKNKCRSCKVAFRPRVAWQDVGDRFLDRIESKAQEREEKVADLESKTAPPFRVPEKKAFDPETGTIRTIRMAPQHWECVADSFMQRMENDAARREAKGVLAQQRARNNEECTFAPRLETSGYDIHFDSGESFFERMERDAMRRQRDKATNELRASYTYSSGDKIFKSSSAWDEPSYFGPHRRNSSNRWV